MTKKEWDDEFSQKITELTGEIWTGSHSLKGLKRVENKIFAVIRKDREHQSIDKLSVGRLPPKLDKLVSNLIRLDRKHQKSETLKRLPSVIQFRNLVANFRCKKTKYFWTNDEVAIAIHKLIKDKLKEK